MAFDCLASDSFVLHMLHILMCQSHGQNRRKVSVRKAVGLKKLARLNIESIFELKEHQPAPISGKRL